MDNQEAIKALVEGKMVRQIDWAPNEFLIHRKTIITNPDLVIENKQWVEFNNKMGDKIPLSQEEMQGCLNRNIPFEEYSSSLIIVNDEDDEITKEIIVIN